MTTNIARAALAAETAAAEAEGIFAPTAEQKKALKRYAVLRARVERDQTEMDAISAKIFAEMDETGALALAVNGRNVALISNTTKTIKDQAGFERDYPTLSAEYALAIAKYVTRQKVIAGRKAIKV